MKAKSQTKSNGVKSLMLGLLLFQVIPTQAQEKIGYSYDAAGNRIQRTIILQAQAKKANASTAKDVRSLSIDNAMKSTVTIYPNPTKGQLRVAISKLDNTDKCALSVFTTTGKLVFNKPNAAASTDIDLSNQSNGIYLLKIELNGSQTTWKIIKQ